MFSSPGLCNHILESPPRPRGPVGGARDGHCGEEEFFVHKGPSPGCLSRSHIPMRHSQPESTRKLVGRHGSTMFAMMHWGILLSLHPLARVQPGHFLWKAWNQ